MNYAVHKAGSFKELEKMAYDKTNWHNRLEAVRKMKRMKSEKVMNILTDMVFHDRVFAVKKEAYNAALRMGVKVNGKPIFLGKKDTGYKLDDFKEIFNIIKKRCHMDNVDVDKIKEEMQKLNPEMYDVMSYEKKGKFNSWIRDIYGTIHQKEK